MKTHPPSTTLCNTPDTAQPPQHASLLLRTHTLSPTLTRTLTFTFTVTLTLTLTVIHSHSPDASRKCSMLGSFSLRNSSLNSSSSSSTSCLHLAINSSRVRLMTWGQSVGVCVCVGREVEKGWVGVLRRAAAISSARVALMACGGGGGRVLGCGGGGREGSGCAQEMQLLVDYHQSITINPCRTSDCTLSASLHQCVRPCLLLRLPSLPLCRSRVLQSLCPPCTQLRTTGPTSPSFAP